MKNQKQIRERSKGASQGGGFEQTDPMLAEEMELSSLFDH